MIDEEWGTWIEHDGKGCPCVGKWVQSQKPGGYIWEGRAWTHGNGGSHDDPSISAWAWRGAIPAGDESIRYRIRRFHAEQTLREIAENIREPEVV